MGKYSRKIGTDRFGACAKPCIIVAAIGTAVTATSVVAQYGAPDRTGVTRFMSRSSMVMTDLNNDCLVSDVDVVMLLMDRMAELYGPDLEVGDLDGDGIETSEDIVTAIGFLMKGAFGKTAPGGDEAVGAADIEQTLLAVAAGDVEGDLNFDGDVNAEDLLVTVDRFGEAVSDYDIDQAARLAAEYMGYIVYLGRDGFMASGCAPDTHLSRVSDTWPPDHPDWWVPNHYTSISRGYEGEEPDPIEHSSWVSSHYPTAPHESETSASWPPNHDWYASSTWGPPGDHQTYTSVVVPEEAHVRTVSQAWPPGHMEAATSTYPPDHEPIVSQAWWPNHTYYDSMGRIMPPVHLTWFTEDKWVHQTENSQAAWPPNHTYEVSNGWGSHGKSISLLYPPGHIASASNTWPGPQPTWPPMHTRAVSESWGEPSDGDWPMFPSDHSWWTTFQDIGDWIDRFPW